MIGFLMKFYKLLILVLFISCDTYYQGYDDKTIDITHDDGSTQTINAYRIDEYQEGIVVWSKDDNGYYEDHYPKELIDYDIY